MARRPPPSPAPPRAEPTPPQPRAPPRPTPPAGGPLARGAPPAPRVPPSAALGEALGAAVKAVRDLPPQHLAHAYENLWCRLSTGGLSHCVSVIALPHDGPTRPQRGFTPVRVPTRVFNVGRPSPAPLYRPPPPPRVFRPYGPFASPPKPIFPDADHERLHPLFAGKQHPDTLVAALKVAADRFTYDPQTGAAVFTGWRKSLEELAAAPVPSHPKEKPDVVKEMRVLLTEAQGPLDFPLLSAQLIVSLTSAPLERRVDLQGANDMTAFWSSLVRCIAATTDPKEPADALDILKRALLLAAPPTGWEADEAACIPGQTPSPPPAPSAAPQHGPFGLQSGCVVCNCNECNGFPASTYLPSPELGRGRCKGLGPVTVRL